jgi:heme-degrading monooxygenase HmoA
MKYALIVHEVADYDAWKKVFDDAAGIRKQAGEIHFHLLRFEKDSNKVVHFSQWSSLEAARGFFESPRVVQIRKDAGVKAPDFIYAEEIEKGFL